MIRIAICDDETQNTKELRELINVFSERLKIEVSVAVYSSGQSLLFDWENPEKYADILYLDIFMPDINGMKVAEQLRRLGFRNEIIFHTRSDAQALDAFDVNAFHYIIKDATTVKKEEDIFKNAVEKALAKTKEYISLSCAGENRSIAINGISHFQVDGRVVTVYYEPKRYFEFYAALGKLENSLCEKGFVRVNRAVIANVSFIKSSTADTVEMKSGEVFAIGRNYRKKVKEEIASWSYGVVK